MLQLQEYFLTTDEEYKQIDSVKEWIESIHNSGNFFSLSLKTLELIRRFNKLYTEVFEYNSMTPGNINQLIIATRGLEKELIEQN